MTTFQLDQCLDSKRFVRDCAAEGRCETVRLPRSLHDAVDPELLQKLMATPNPLVTFDRPLPRDHTAFIPERHPGLLVISNFPAPQTMTIRIAQRVLKRFKAEFSDWDQMSWSNSVVEITSLGVEVWHVEQGHLIRDDYFSFDSADWQARLRNLLHDNAERGSSS
jgi:hypothetical protein